MKKVENNIGIVLNINSYTDRIILFDQDLGKIYFPLNQKKQNWKLNNLCNGALVNYNLIKQNDRIKANDINIIDVPFLLAKKNILFFHHVIELCNFFVPIGMSCKDLFELLFYALYCFNELDDLKKQKIFLTKFFLQVGTYPENELMKSYFYEIMITPIDSLIKAAIDLKKEKELSLWIIKCVNMHPHFKYFKTTNFLNELVIS